LLIFRGDLRGPSREPLREPARGDRADLRPGGYRAHEVLETVPLILLDSLEAIDSDRIPTLVGYLEQYTEYLVFALLPKDAAALNEEYRRVEAV
jgi:hypothetical protein